MRVQQTPTRTNTRQFSLATQARAFGVILRGEFEVPFTFYDAQTLAEVGADERTNPGEPAGTLPGTPKPDASAVRQLAEGGRVRVAGVGGRYRLSLLLYENQRPILLGTGEIPTAARTAAEELRERTMLEKWLQAVSDRLRLSDQLAKEPRPGKHSCPWTTCCAGSSPTGVRTKICSASLRPLSPSSVPRALPGFPEMPTSRW